MPALKLEEICTEVYRLCREVGAFIQVQRDEVRAGDIETKSLNSLVSYVDKEAEKQIIARLEKLIPESGFIAEEGSSSKVGERYNWIIDPLDGTTNFLHQIPVYSISIALQDRDELVLGLVYEISRQECFCAWQGAGAYLNGETIQVSPTAKLADSLLATGFPYYDFKRLEKYFEVLMHLAQNSRGIRRMGSAAVDLAYVACGRFDGFFEYSLNPWDVAAGAFIVQQAGGQVGDFSGGENWLHGKEIVVGNAAIYGELQKLLSEKLS